MRNNWRSRVEHVLPADERGHTQDYRLADHANTVCLCDPWVEIVRLEDGRPTGVIVRHQERLT